MTVVEPSTSIQLIALDLVYGNQRRSPLSSPSNRIVLGIISLHLLLTTFLASHLNLWIDEAYSFATTDHDLPTTVQWALGFEEQAPFYFVLLWIARHIHDSVLVARLPSILATATTLWLSSRISQQLFPTVHRAWIVLALAFNPFIIAIALEARCYAWAVMLSTLLLWLFLQAYAKPLLDPTAATLEANSLTPLKTDNWARWAYGATAVVSLYSHYFLAFQIAAQGVILLIVTAGFPERRRPALKSLMAYCIDSSIITLLSLPLISIVGQQLTALQDNTAILEGSSIFKTTQTALNKTLFRTLVYLLPSDPAGTPGWPWKLSRLLVGLWFLALAWGRRQHLRFNVTLVWLINSLVMFQLWATFTLVPNIEYRHSILAVGLVYFSTLGLISLLPRTRRRLLLSFCLIILLGLNSHSLFQLYRPLAKQGDYFRVGEYLAKVVAPQDSLVVFNNEVALALSHYYPPNSVNRIAPSVPPLIALPQALFDPASNDIPKYQQSQLTLTSPQQIEQALILANPAKPNAVQQELEALLQQLPMTPPAQEATPSQKDERIQELEAKIRRANLSETTEVQVREALDLPPLDKTSPPPTKAAIQLFLNNLDPSQLTAATSQPSLPQTLWLVKDNHLLTAMDSFDESYQLLDDFMEQHYRLLQIQHFHGSLVQKWQRLPKEFAPITES